MAGLVLEQGQDEEARRCPSDRGWPEVAGLPRPSIGSIRRPGTPGGLIPVQSLLGVGIYYPAEGARFLRVPAYSLRRWAQGYTYWSENHRTRAASRPVIRPDLPVIRGQRALSFLELMELRVVAELRRRGLSLQHIRTAAQVAREVLQTKHPFATRRIFTDRKRILAYLEPEPQGYAMIELVKERHHQLIFGQILEPLLEDLDFDQESGIAQRWWPLGKRSPVVLDPKICFGAPTITGTRVRTDILAGMAKAEAPVASARAFDVPVAAVKAALEFERQRLAA